MITNLGRVRAAESLAHDGDSIGQTIAFGIGTTAPTVNDTTMEFEIGRSPVTYSAYDPLNNKIILRASMPSDLPATISEIGLFDQVDPWENIPAQDIRVSFGDDSGIWSGGSPTWSTTPGRSGNDMLVRTGTGQTAADMQYDLSGLQPNDKILLSAIVVSGTTAITVDFMTDASNYYRWSIASPGTGEKIYSTTVNALSITGTPSLSKINRIRVGNTNGGVSFDMLRALPMTAASAPGTLVSRSVITPIVINPNVPQDVEIHIEVDL